MANKPGEANFFPNVPMYPEMGTFQPVYGKFDLTTYIQGASDYEIMAFLVGKYNACLEAYGNITKLSTDTITACKQLQDWINSWFTNLDVQEELNNKIDSMVQDGSFGRLLHQTFDAQINQQTTNAVTQWLVANVTPTGSAVVVDKSLSIEGAAADAKVTGKLKEDLVNFSLMNNSTDRHLKIVGSFWCGNLEGDEQVGQKLVMQRFEPMTAIKLIPVMKGDKIKLSCVSYGISKVYYIVDNDMTILSHGTNSFNGILDITDENSKFLAVTQYTEASFDFECYLISHNVEMIYNVEEKIYNTNQTDKMIEKDGKFYTTQSEHNLVGEKIAEQSYDKMKTYYPIRVFKGDKYRLSTKAYGVAKSYYITDKDNTVLEIGGETYDSILKIEQENAYYLYVNYFKESGYDFHLCLVTQDFLYSTNYNEDKKVSFLGDSITAGTGTTICYHMYLAQKYGWHCYNYGIGGTGFVVRNNTPDLSGEGREGRGTSEVITVGNNNFLDRVSQLPTDSDMIVVFGGVNDWLNSVALETFRTNVTGVMDYLQTNRTNASVICLLPLKSSWKTTNSLNLTLQDYIDVIKEICMAKSIITVDLNNKSNINPWNDVCKTELIPDGLHPNEKGHKRLFNLIKTLCCDLIN